MDIGSKNGYPSGALSNFAPHPFEIDGIKCNSMEGFLQSLKFSNPEMQEYVCTLVGMAAKRKGHAALLGQSCLHCPIFPTAASRRSLDRFSVPVWPVILSDRLSIVALVGRYPTN